jgi:thiamine biosynthesis lipoprotein ApbE
LAKSPVDRVPLRRRVTGKVIAHCLDPAAGTPIDNGIESDSELAACRIATDAWAAAFLLLGA